MDLKTSGYCDLKPNKPYQVLRVNGPKERWSSVVFSKQHATRMKYRYTFMEGIDKAGKLLIGNVIDAAHEENPEDSIMRYAVIKVELADITNNNNARANHMMNIQFQSRNYQEIGNLEKQNKNNVKN